MSRLVSASQHAWVAAGSPAHSYIEQRASGVCATCAAPIGSGVPLSAIETPTTANHADYFRFGSRHVCSACAWLFGAGKGRPGNYIATPGRMEYAVISLESVVQNKRPWLEVLRDLSALAPEAPVAGVMTTDVKPRLWPRVRMCTIDRFGLYIHAPDYDVSEWREFDLHQCLGLIEKMIEPLAAGFAKASVFHGLLRDHARASKDPARVIAWEARLAPHRSRPYFLPALIAAGVTKEHKHDVKLTEKPAGNAQPTPANSDQFDQAQSGLF